MAGNRSRVPLGDGQAGLFPDENFETDGTPYDGLCGRLHSKGVSFWNLPSGI